MNQMEHIIKEAIEIFILAGESVSVMKDSFGRHVMLNNGDILITIERYGEVLCADYDVVEKLSLICGVSYGEARGIFVDYLIEKYIGRSEKNIGMDGKKYKLTEI